MIDMLGNIYSGLYVSNIRICSTCGGKRFTSKLCLSSINRRDDEKVNKCWFPKGTLVVWNVEEVQCNMSLLSNHSNVTMQELC